MGNFRFKELRELDRRILTEIFHVKSDSVLPRYAENMAVAWRLVGWLKARYRGVEVSLRFPRKGTL